MTSTCLHQPNFIPWTKLIAKIAACDVYVAYDSVQFTRTEYHNRQRLRGRHDAVLLSVPVQRAKSRQPLCDVQLESVSDWRGYHLRIIEQEYRRAPYFDAVFALVQTVYERGHTNLVDLNLDLLQEMLGYLEFDTQITRATDFPHTGDNTDRLIQLTRLVGADEHLTSTWGTERRYIEWDRVAAAGIKVRTQAFTHPTYRQQFEPFVPNLGVLDLLFASGPDARRHIQDSSSFPFVD